MRKNYTLFILLITLCGFVFLQYFKAPALKQQSDIEQELSRMLSGNQRIERVQAARSYYKIFDSSSSQAPEPSAYAFLTSELAKHIIGYTGAIEMLVVTDPQLNVTRIRVLSHQETPGYMDDLQGYVNRLVDQGVNPLSRLGEDVDGISGATVTSQAVLNTLKESLIALSVQIGSFQGEFINDQKNAWPVDQIFFPLILFVVAFIASFLKNKWLRWIAIIAGLFYFGFLTQTMFSIIHVANLTMRKGPSLAVFPLIFMIIGLALLSVLFYRNIYCRSLCPFGGIQEITWSFARKIKIKRLQPTSKIDFLRNIRFLVLFASLLIAFILGNTQAIIFEPYVLLFGSRLTWLGLLFLGLLILISLFKYRFWCCYFCPVGALCSIIGGIKQRKKNTVQSRDCLDE